MKRLIALAATLPAPLFAASFERPVPQAQTEVAEFWFLVASITLVASLIAVHMLVRRR
ncbi:hypothetical protein [Maritimibacter sp. UBA3975]|uniref:hypothetical protein n=1 Tax=Maritimibacter sp. UBA3975 TaxID=1946833 RepID=UPI0025BD25C6|nr:hypothetical protein [Maritimibacter sp. UBA3975]|tara:strand:+ start:28092 stop:28265 length:174 start_codon:yes stop_codon:yes gene_type:complete